MAQSKSLLRGAETWPDPSAIVSPAFSFYDRFHLRGPNAVVSLLGRFGGKYHLSLGGRYVDDNKPLVRFKSREEDYRNERSGATELFSHFHLAPWGNRFLRWEIEYAKEIHRHYGSYGFTTLSLPVFKFTQLRVGAGFGDKKHSEWLYGKSGSGGLLHTEIGIEHNLVKLPWRGVIHQTLTFHHIEKEANKSAYYIRGNSTNLVYNLRVLWLF
jgi:hypothetical protein